MQRAGFTCDREKRTSLLLQSIRHADSNDEKGVRVAGRQCKAQDTVLSGAGKPVDPKALYKNKFNH